jgi:DNA-binding transcriptional MerR regulator
MTLRNALHSWTERRQHLDQHFYYTGQFARKASVTVRTLRYYDKVGLLEPAHFTEAGYRLYTDADLLRLQRILALKFLGFSLEEIRQCLRVGPKALSESLALQKAMMCERRAQLNSVIKAIDETQEKLRGNEQDWEAIVHIIQVIQMQQTDDWRKKYFSEEDLKKMEELSKQYYTEEQRQKIAEWGKNFSEEDQRVATQQWSDVIAELKRIIAAGKTPASPEAQALAERWIKLVEGFTHGDEGIQNSLNNMWQAAFNDSEQFPFARPYSREEMEFIVEAIKLHRQACG